MSLAVACRKMQMQMAGCVTQEAPKQLGWTHFPIVRATLADWERLNFMLISATHLLYYLATIRITESCTLSGITQMPT